ncbi:transporter substrate-binding domain-containing protein, partial [Bacillus subtilis]
MKIFKKILVLLAVLMMVVTPFAAITADTTSSSSSADTAKTTDDSLKKVKEKGTLVVGLSADYPPYEFTTKQDGKTEYVGIDIQIAKKFAKDLGVKLVIKNMNFDSLLVALETGKIDT